MDESLHEVLDFASIHRLGCLLVVKIGQKLLEEGLLSEPSLRNEELLWLLLEVLSKLVVCQLLELLVKLIFGLIQLCERIVIVILSMLANVARNLDEFPVLLPIVVEKLHLAVLVDIVYSTEPAFVCMAFDQVNRVLEFAFFVYLVLKANKPIWIVIVLFLFFLILFVLKLLVLLLQVILSLLVERNLILLKLLLKLIEEVINLLLL